MMSLFCFARFVILYPAATSSSSFLSLCSPVCHCCMAHRTLCTCAWAHVSECWLNDSQFGCRCVYKAALFNKQPPCLTAARCMRNSDSKLHDVEITLVHSAACMYYLYVYVCLVTAIGSCKILFLLYIELTHSPFLLLSPFVPNKHLHVCMPVILCVEVWVFFPCILYHQPNTCTHTNTVIKTHMPRVCDVKFLQLLCFLWWWLLNVFVL